MEKGFETGQKRKRSTDDDYDRFMKEKELEERSGNRIREKVLCKEHEWVVFRFLVPENIDDDMVRNAVEGLKQCFNGRKNVRIEFFEGPPKAKERAVMVAVEGESERPFPSLLIALVNLQQFFMRYARENTFQSLPALEEASLLVLDVEAQNLISYETLNRIANACCCSITVRTSGNPSFDYLCEDMIINVKGKSFDIFLATIKIVSHLAAWFHYPKDLVNSMERNTRIPPPEGRHVGISKFGRKSVEVASFPSSLPVTLCAKRLSVLYIPLSYADAVIGVDGEHIEDIRRLSGATVAVTEMDDEKRMMVEITDIGSRDRVAKAEELILDKLERAGGSELAEDVRNDIYFGGLSTYAQAADVLISS